ncbi:DUF1513 domain-containing protein [Aquincola sp. MAHUQ-54]|uniref:DUF1513 domain-containing protein n=1 Tax=Aquincola agrisoli TaxID=3119538 RepID=A0AAW9QIM3_9BURK
MATDPAAACSRRGWLRGALGCAIAGTPLLAAAAAPGGAPRLFAAWDLEDGRHQIGCLTLRPDGAVPQPLAADAVLDVPTRAHGLVPLRDGSVLVAARRPGEWLLRWHPAKPQATQWHWMAEDRAFSGHVQPLGRHLYTTESDLESGAGLLVRRDAATLERLAEWPTGGVDNHALLPDGEGGLFVANGGVATRPETGRTKIDLAGMDSSLVRLDAATGRITGQWRAADRRLSLRHLAWQGRHLGIALQAQHEDAGERRAAPVLAVLSDARGGAAARPTLRVIPAPEPLGGYGGDICAADGGFAVSCPRVNAAARWSVDGRWQGLVAHQEAYALVSLGERAWVAGPRGLQPLAPGRHATPWRQALLPDNHAALASGA